MILPLTFVSRVVTTSPDNDIISTCDPMNTPPSANLDLADDDEISLFDLWQMLLDGWRWIAAGIALGLASAALYLVSAPTQYEATALVQIGQIGQPGQLGQVGAAPVESPARVVERVMFPTFKEAVIKTNGWDAKAPATRIYAGSLKAAITKGTDLIEFKVRGTTRQEADVFMAATIAYLATLHKGVAQPAIDSLKTELIAIAAEVKETEQLVKDLERSARMQSQVLPRDRFSESMLYTQLLTAKENRLRELKRRETQYREWIGLTGASVTALFVPLSVPEQPVAPKKHQAVLLAALAGLFLGVMALFVHRGWRNHRRLLPATTV